MKGFLSLFSRCGRRRGKTEGEWASASRFVPGEQPGRSQPSGTTDNVRNDGSAEKLDAPNPPLNDGASEEKEEGAFLRMMAEPIRDESFGPFRFSESGCDGNAGEGGREEFYSGLVFRAEVKDEDIPFHRGGFAAQTSGEWQESYRESFRLLFDQAEKTREILSQLTETADEIRKELMI